MRIGNDPRAINAGRNRVNVASITDGLVASQSLQNAKKLSFGLIKIYTRLEVILHFPLFLQFGDNFRWTELRFLELEDMFLYAEEFVDFINLHADTLEEATLIEMVFLSLEEWQKVIYTLKNASLTRIRITTPLNIFEDGKVSTVLDVLRQNELLGGLIERMPVRQEESHLPNRARVQSPPWI